MSYRFFAGPSIGLKSIMFATNILGSLIEMVMAESSSGAPLTFKTLVINAATQGTISVAGKRFENLMAYQIGLGSQTHQPRRPIQANGNNSDDELDIPPELQESLCAKVLGYAWRDTVHFLISSGAEIGIYYGAEALAAYWGFDKEAFPVITAYVMGAFVGQTWAALEQVVIDKREPVEIGCCPKPRRAGYSSI